MNQQRSDFFGAVLKAIACTPNFSDDLRSYQHDVIEATRALRDLEEQTDAALTRAEMAGIAERLNAILRAKCVPEEERLERLNELQTKFGLS